MLLLHMLEDYTNHSMTRGSRGSCLTLDPAVNDIHQMTPTLPPINQKGEW